MNSKHFSESGVLSNVISYETNEIVECARGSILHAQSGRDYIDFAAGVAVHPCGHGHPEILAAIGRQLAKTTHVADTMRHAPELELAQRIAELLSGALPGSDCSVLFLNSGSESVDAAAKLAVKATGRTDFLAFDGAFHGRTLFATALSRSKRLHWDAYEPLLAALRPHIHHAASPANPSRCTATAEALVGDLDHRLAAVILESEQGEGGYLPFSPDVAQRITDAAHAAGALVIVDEVQSGLGRTGRWFGFEHLGIAPDIVVFGKAIGGGLPLAGIAARRDIMEKWQTGEHGTTFGGNPLACAAGLAAVAVIERDRLLSNADRLGQRVRARLEPMIGRLGIDDVRGWGLMIGVELRDKSGRPDYARCARVKEAALAGGLLVLTCGARIGDADADNSSLRLIPALNIPDSVLDQGLSILLNALAQ